MLQAAPRELSPSALARPVAAAAAAAAAAATRLSLTAWPPSPSRPQTGTVAVKIALDWTPNTNSHAGLYIAKAQGLFAAKGLDVTIVSPHTGSEVAAAATAAWDSDPAMHVGC